MNSTAANATAFAALPDQPQAAPVLAQALACHRSRTVRDGRAFLEELIEREGLDAFLAQAGPLEIGKYLIDCAMAAVGRGRRRLGYSPCQTLAGFSTEFDTVAGILIAVHEDRANAAQVLAGAQFFRDVLR